LLHTGLQTIGLPVHSASHIPSTGAVLSTQNNFTEDVFTTHPPATTSVISLMMKAAMRQSSCAFPVPDFSRADTLTSSRCDETTVVRQVNDLSRKLESMGCTDYRQQLEFQQLDALITAFQ
jgi:hypothetical protein